MNDYISRQALIDFIDKTREKYSITVSNACNFKEIARKVPAAEVKPVVRGTPVLKIDLLDTKYTKKQKRKTGRYFIKNALMLKNQII